MTIHERLVLIMAAVFFLCFLFIARMPDKWKKHTHCRLGLHGPNWFGPEWGRCGEGFVRECPHCGMRWYGTEVERGFGVEAYRSIGDWKTRAQCIKDGEWLKDKFTGQKF